MLGRRSAPRRFAAFLGVLFSLAFSSTRAAAQAVLPPQGEANLAVSYGNIFIGNHLFSTGNPYDVGHIRSNSVFLAGGYAVSDRFAIDLGIPYVISEYHGKSPHSVLDNTGYHGTWQDFRIGARYQLVRGPFFLSPLVAAVIPSHNYVYFAHSAAGRDLWEVAVGAAGLARLDRLLPNSYVQLMYAYSFVERVSAFSDIQHDRSDINLQFGYFITPSLGIQVLGSAGITHGGIDFPVTLAGVPAFRASPYWPYHDQLSREKHLNLGGGFTYSLTGAVDVYATYVRTVWGINAHEMSNGFNFGFGWSFSPEQLVRRVAGRPISDRPPSQ